VIAQSVEFRVAVVGAAGGFALGIYQWPAGTTSSTDGLHTTATPLVASTSVTISTAQTMKSAFIQGPVTFVPVCFTILIFLSLTDRFFRKGPHTNNLW